MERPLYDRADGRPDRRDEPPRERHVVLDPAPRDRGPAAAHTSPQPDDQCAAARILVVDDDANIRALVVAILASAGHDGVEAADGGEALGLLAGDPFDLMITDSCMPGLDGAKLAGAAVIAQPRLPVLVVSGHAQRDTQLTFDGSEAAYLQKPFTSEQLLGHVRDLLGGSGVPTQPS